MGDQLEFPEFHYDTRRYDTLEVCGIRPLPEGGIETKKYVWTGRFTDNGWEYKRPKI